MYADLFLALLERRNPRKHPLLSALLYEFCPQAAFFWRSGLDPHEVHDPVWKALQDYAFGGTLVDQLGMYELDDFSETAQQYVTDIQDFRASHLVRSPETSALFPSGRPTAEEKRNFTQAIEKHFGDWDNLYAYIRTWAFLIGDWRLRSGITNDKNYSLRKTQLVFVLPELGEGVYWQIWAWWVKIEHNTSVHLGLLTPDGLRDPFRPWLTRTSGLDGSSAWPSTPILHRLNYQTGEVSDPENLLTERQFRSLLLKLATVAESGPYPPLNMLRHLATCQFCGFRKFCYNEERPTDLALRGLEDVPTWQNDAR
jgi:hypothetical protein